MTIRPLLIDDAVKRRAAEVIAYSEKHPYIPGPDVAPPGDNPHHVLHVFSGFRVVFSITINSAGKRFRHMSISVVPGKWPNPIQVFTIAELLGFSGWDGRTQTPPAGWGVGIDTNFNCVTLVQKLELAH